MRERLDCFKVAAEPMKAMVTFENSVKNCGLEHSLVELVKTRASQINGCAYCIHMHTTDARRAGEREERLYLLSAWRESSAFTLRERAALDWTEALTNIADKGAPDDVYEHVCAHLSEEEVVKLTLLIGAINIWNRIAVGFRSQHPELADAA